MSDKCGNCDCADKTQCVKGNSYGIAMEPGPHLSHLFNQFEVQEFAENDGKCKCGTSCTCTNCGCGH